MSDRLALYTTVYRAATPYLREWYDSVAAQTDRDFDLWIGVDGMTCDAVCVALGAAPAARWVIGEPGDSPARLRTRAIQRMLPHYDALLFVDCDDLLDPTRVAGARAALRTSDVAACALKIVDASGRDCGITFAPPTGQDAAALLPRYNVFGLSNTAYRTAVLARCLPVPRDAVLMDWLLATRAWVLGARLAFDPIPRMRYRQYEANIARVVQPFGHAHILAAAERVVAHYRLVLSEPAALPATHRRALCQARARAERFQRAVQSSRATLDRYVTALNALTPAYVWWWCVAHPQLEDVWSN
ncbi:MAG TPA: hypothetical protein VFW98_03460 [Gemmatimonadaceae bacterium]|nr:hypothetical protein [Gemmatimonadaceae bacterium]